MTCTWEPDPACLGSEWEELDDDLKDRALMLATSSLQALTLNRVGTCPITIRPCPEPLPCSCEWNPHPIRPGEWLNVCGCRTARYCAPLSEVDLDGPIGYIDEIKVDGTALALDNNDWRIDDGHLLVWQGSGASPIPETQDLNKPDTEVGTWSITYSKSYPVLADARLAVAYLAMEFAEACQPQGACSLPRGVTSVVRNGVTFSIEAGLFPNGLTGLEIVDQFILKWAPAGSPSQSAQVHNPRKRKARVTAALPTRSPAGSL
jgi:hypothetical protein